MGEKRLIYIPFILSPKHSIWFRLDASCILIYLLTVSTMRFWLNVSLPSIILQMPNQGDSRSSVISKISALCLLCVSLISFFFSITRVHINFALTLHPICSIICWTVIRCLFRATGNSLSLHISLGSPGKLSLIDAIYSFDPNDKITEKFSPTLHHTWEKSAQLLSANHNKNLINQNSAHSLLSSLFV